MRKRGGRAGLWRKGQACSARKTEPEQVLPCKRLTVGVCQGMTVCLFFFFPQKMQLDRWSSLLLPVVGTGQQRWAFNLFPWTSSLNTHRKKGAGRGQDRASHSPAPSAHPLCLAVAPPHSSESFPPPLPVLLQLSAALHVLPAKHTHMFIRYNFILHLLDLFDIL